MEKLDLSILSDRSLLFLHLDILPRHATACITDMKSNVSIHKITTNRGKKERKIYAPSNQLKWVQNQIRRNLLSRLTPESCVHGFVQGRGIVSNATQHSGVNRAWVMNIDLKNFFPGIWHDRVLDIFSHWFNLDEKTARAMTMLTTFDGHLCQGFSTSPEIANIAAHGLDLRLMKMASDLNITYTRYADDLTFSSSSSNDVDPRFVLDAVRRVVDDEGFRVNEKKIAIMRKGLRQKVTGLVIAQDGGISIPRRTRHLLRSAVHHWAQQTPERKRQIRGWISYLASVSPGLAATLQASTGEDMEHRTWSKGVGQDSFSEDVASLLSSSTIKE